MKQLLDRIKAVLEDENMDRLENPDVAKMTRIESIMAEYDPQEAQAEMQRFADEQLYEFLDNLSGPSYRVDDAVCEERERLRAVLGK